MVTHRLTRALLIGAVTVLAARAAGESASEASPAAASLLDGRTFHGEIFDEKGGRSKDRRTFKGGKFQSALCATLGFTERPYWTRVEGDTLVWRGTLRGDQLEATSLWTKERWYWSIRREYRFRGTRTE